MVIPILRVALIVVTVGLLTFTTLAGLFYESVQVLAPGRFEPIRLLIVAVAMAAAAPPAMERSSRAILSPIILGTLLGPVAFVALTSGMRLDSDDYFQVMEASALLGAQLGLGVVPCAVLFSVLTGLLYDRATVLVPDWSRFIAGAFSAGVLLAVLLVPPLGVRDALMVRWPFRPAHDPSFVMEPSVWKGETRFAGHARPFELVFEARPDDGTLIGYLSWEPGPRLSVRGTFSGNYVEFADTEYLLGDDDRPLGNVKAVWIDGDRMVGTDKSGLEPLRARRIPGPPPPPTPDTAVGRVQVAQELGARYWEAIKSCNAHSHTLERQICYRRLAIRTREPYFCKTTGDAAARRTCRAAVAGPR